MSGIIKVILSFFRKGEEVAIVPVDISKHQGVLEKKEKKKRIKNKTSNGKFLAVKEQAFQQ